MSEHHSFRDDKCPPGEPVLGKTYRADGWAYLETPGWVPNSWLEEAREVWGEGEYYILAMSTRDDHLHMQFLLSPKAQDATKAKNKRNQGMLS